MHNKYASYLYNGAVVPRQRQALKPHVSEHEQMGATVHPEHLLLPLLSGQLLVPCARYLLL